jgi:hypothetical protein
MEHLKNNVKSACENILNKAYVMDAFVGRTYQCRWPKTAQQQAQEEGTQAVDN